jgi:hypothetical protein
MNTLTLKVPEILNQRLAIYADKNKLSKSEIIRKALEEFFSSKHIDKKSSFYDIAKDLAGSIEGTPDLSVNKSYMDEYGA